MLCRYAEVMGGWWCHCGHPEGTVWGTRQAGPVLEGQGGQQGHKEMAVGWDCSLCHQLSPILLLADINECEEVGSSEPLCRGGTCENTEGSYRCQCLPGYVALARSHHCVPQTAQNPAAA